MSVHDSTPLRTAGTSRIPISVTVGTLLLGLLLGLGEATAQDNPDGDWVAYQLVSRVEEDNSSSSEVWVAATDGDPAPSRISPAGVQASDPSWGPDGFLRYVSGDNAFAVAPDSRPGSRNVLRLEALTAIPSPDGTMVAALMPASVPEVEPV